MAGLMLAPIAAGVLAMSTVSADISTDELQQMRREAAQRERRIIFNNDGCDATHYAIEATPEALLEVRTSPLIGSQVDTIFYCTNRGTFARHSHKSEAAETFLVTEGRFENNIMPELIERGTDPLEIMVQFARENDFEIFWSERMNDTHDAGRPENLSQWKKDHPECLVGAEDNRPPRGRWSSVDYAHEQVRDTMAEIIEDVITRYDVAGIELDFFRHPCFFASQAWEGEASAEDIATMTGFVRRIRQLCDRVALERGKPLLIAVRIQDDADYRRALGLDLEAWLDQDLVDIVTAGGYFRLNEWEETVELGHRYGKQVYAGLSESRIREREGRNALAAYRARATNALQAGVDGIYMFNYFKPRKPLWHEVGSLETMRGKTKHFYATYRGPRTARAWLEGGGRYYSRPTLCPDAPVTVTSDQPAESEIVIREDLQAALNAGFAPTVRVSVQVADLADTGQLALALNGQRLPVGTMEDGWLRTEAHPNLLRKGRNTVKMSLTEDAEDVKITDLMVAISYDQGA
jgi:hypothetical protein